MSGNPLGVLFTVSFLLAVTGCVMGCAYNYSVLQKRGEDIVPGIQYLHMAKHLGEAFVNRQGDSSYGVGSRGVAETTEGYQAL